MDQAVMDRMRAAGFKLAGGMWGECFWKVLAPGLVASIAANPEGCSPPADEKEECVLHLYVPADHAEEGWFAEFAEGLAFGPYAEAPSTETFITEAGSLSSLLRLAERFEAAFKMKGGAA
jgi:hypothetical protein